MGQADEIVARARGCVGARFRPHGREARFGLDCVGVVSIATGRLAPGDYALRSADAAAVEWAMLAAGLVPIAPAEAGAGDIVLIAAAATQLHLAVLTPDGFVHADVGLRRVVEAPGRPTAIIAAWRVEEWMATLVLGTVGTAFGGPLGGAIGAAIGNRIDHAVIGGGARRQGPRLGDRSVQTSSYGSAIPKLFGTMRVAGTVIWATDLREDVHRSGGGKGNAKTTSYSYSASFAVALSGRPIRSVGRIWADGKLLRGAGGEWRGDTVFRLWTGGEDQPADPLIAAAEGIGATPAHRGIAYAVFENLQLADFGNRIPSLTFEVVADEGDATLGAIAGTLSGGLIASGDVRAVGGYAASGESVRGALEPLDDAFPLALHDDGVRLARDDGAATALPGDALGAMAEARAARRQRERRARGMLPVELSVHYYEPARDYQAGLQRARREAGGRADAIELPASLGAEQAKGLAEAALARAWARRETLTVRVPWRWAEIAAGASVLLDGGRWRVRERTLEHLALELVLERDGHSATPAPAASGRVVAEDDAPAGATVIALLDLPALDDRIADAPSVWLAAAGHGPGWRRAETSLSFDGGASWSAAGRTAAPAIIGGAASLLAPGPRELIDAANLVDVDLLHEGMALSGAGDDALWAGANLAAIGGELIQFGSAEQTGATRWRMGRLLRGRRGSDGAIGGHAIGERFVLLDAATLLPLDVPLARIGTTLQASATGPGDVGVAATATLVIGGAAVRPPAPVALTAVRLGDGTLRFGWTRRSRAGWAWLDGADAPLGEDTERYTLELRQGAARLRGLESAVPAHDYSPADQAADGWSGGAIALGVRQLGARALSFEAAAAWTF